MNLQAFKDELFKIADIAPPSPSRPQPMSAVAKGPSVPHPGGLKPVPTQGAGMWDAISAGLKSSKGTPSPMVGILKNAMPTSGSSILPGATATAKSIGGMAFPKPSAVPSMSNVNPWQVKHMAAAASPTSMTAATVAPKRWQGAATPSMAPKLAADLTQDQRSGLPKKDFAVSAKKSNTGKEAYPIPDRQHARSALGFAKMHGDSADLEAVRAKIRAKYPDMLKEKNAAGLSEAAGRAIGGKAGDFIANHHNAFDLGGLGVLGVAPAVSVAHQVKNKLTGKEVDRGELARDSAEVAGLGTLAAPGIITAMRGASHSL